MDSQQNTVMKSTIVTEKRRRVRRKGNRTDRASGHGGKVRKDLTPEKLKPAIVEEIKEIPDEEKVVVVNSNKQFSWAKIAISKVVPVQEEPTDVAIKMRSFTEAEKIIYKINLGIRMAQNRRKEQLFNNWYNQSHDYVELMVYIAGVAIKKYLNISISNDEKNDLVNALYESAPRNPRKNTVLIAGLDTYDPNDLFYDEATNPHEELLIFVRTHQLPFFKVCAYPNYGSISSKMDGSWYPETVDHYQENENENDIDIEMEE